jgi:hypothetical protein
MWKRNMNIRKNSPSDVSVNGNPCTETRLINCALLDPSLFNQKACAGGVEMTLGEWAAGLHDGSMASRLLDEMCRRGKIEAGEYVVEVCW